jgi:hypothetical protein
MSDETKNWNILYEKYPNLFENRLKSPRESCMSFGVECGLGWYEIISNVCWMIKQHEDNKRWQTKWKEKKNQEIKDSMGISIEGEEPEYFPVKFDQVKEKYGGLRLYFSGGDEYVEGLISMAEAFSYTVCEVCGNKAEPNKGGWISTLCESCRVDNKTV